MSRLTINLDDQIHRALKETAARQKRTIGSIIEERLLLRGIRPYASARELGAKARQASPPARILHAMLEGKLFYLLSAGLLEEYPAVLRVYWLPVTSYCRRNRRSKRQ
jgi:hypothetical protein